MSSSTELRRPVVARAATRTATRAARTPERSRGRELVTVAGLRVSFGLFAALDGVAFGLAGTGVTGLIGVNGAGKTTLLHTILGLQRASEGAVSVHCGLDEIGYCPDTPSFEPWLTCREVLAQSVLLGGRGRGAVHRDAVDGTLAVVGLHEYRDRRVGGFSRGMRQRLGIAATLVREPAVLLLDEPTSALDPRGREDVMALTTELGRMMLVVFSSHILDDVEVTADRLLVLHRGRLVHDGSPAAFAEAHGRPPCCVVQLSVDARGVAARLAADGVSWWAPEPGGRSLAVAAEHMPELLRAAAFEPGEVVSVRRDTQSLQQVFLSATPTTAAATAEESR